jgi:hypothetical protein
MCSSASAALLTIAALVTITSCKPKTSLVPVEGKVTLDGKPLDNAAVSLNPTRGNGPGPFTATTNSDGRFSLGSVAHEAAGAVADNYIVLITTVKPDPNSPDGAPPPGQKEVVPAKYRDGSERYTVPQAGTKEANFDIKTH